MNFKQIFQTQFRMKNTNDQKGYILIATFMMVAVVSVTAMAVYTRSYAFARTTEGQKNELLALEMAEAGIDKAMTQLAASSSYTGTGGYIDFSSGNFNGGYSVAVTTPSGAASNIRQIAVTGYAPGNTATAIGYRAKASSAYVSLPTSSYFTKAIFANTSYSNTGNGTTDSYNTSVAAYSALTAGSNGDIGTNSIVAGAVTLSGNALVKGDAVIGTGGSTGTVITTSGNASITGTKAAQTTNTTLSTPSTSIASSGARSISGNNTLNLTAGTYHYSSFSISGNGMLTTSGDVTIYVSGPVSISGNGAAAFQNLPQNLKIYVTNNSSVSVSGNGSLYAAIYAPLSAVSVSGNGSIYGAVVGNTVSMSGNANFHYDEALGNLGGTTSGDPTVLTYVQTGNSAWTN